MPGIIGFRESIIVLILRFSEEYEEIKKRGGFFDNFNQFGGLTEASKVEIDVSGRKYEYFSGGRKTTPIVERSRRWVCEILPTVAEQSRVSSMKNVINFFVVRIFPNEAYLYVHRYSVFYRKPNHSRAGSGINGGNLL